MLKRIRYFAICLVIVMATGAISGVRAEDEVPMSGVEQIAWVQTKTSESRAICSRVQTLLDRAREEKDTIKITCLDDKLTQIHVSLRGIEERAESLKIAHNANDVTTANQHFSIIKIYVSRISGLSAEADNCLGETDIVLGKTETTVEIEGDINVDPSEEASQETIEGPPPDELVHVSGYY